MGRRNKAYSKDLHQQAYDRLTGMQAFGESKKEAVANGTDKEKIFSFNTYKSYWKHTKYFIEYIKSEHPECTTLKSAKKYVNEWLQVRADQGLSAWTVQLEAKAMGKLYGISPDDKDYRAEYATDIYRKYARPIEEIPYDKVNKGTGKRYQSEVYSCRKDEAGKKLDKVAMLVCSKALGHNRISVVADNYIRGL